MAAEYTYDRGSFFANLRAQGHAISAEAEEQFDKAFKKCSPNGDILMACFEGFDSAIAFFQNLLKSLGFDISFDNIGKALDTGSQTGSLKSAARYSQLINIELIKNGIDQRTADILTGNESNGTKSVAGNINDELLKQNNIIPKNSERFATLDTTTVAAPIGPAAANQTLGLTGNTPSA